MVSVIERVVLEATLGASVQPVTTRVTSSHQLTHTLAYQSNTGVTLALQELI